MTNPPRVFISTTSADLRHVRGIVRDALLSTGCLPVVQEHFPPDYREVAEMLRARIAECDALIHIAGLRYGAEPDPATLPPDTRRRSFTQLEYHAAREEGLEKIFTFICPEEFPYLTVDDNGNPFQDEPDELRRLQRAHREHLLTRKQLHYEVSDPDDVGARIRELHLELASLKGQVTRTTRRIYLTAAAVVAALLLVFAALQLNHIGISRIADTINPAAPVSEPPSPSPDRQDPSPTTTPANETGPATDPAPEQEPPVPKPTHVLNNDGIQTLVLRALPEPGKFFAYAAEPENHLGLAEVNALVHIIGRQDTEIAFIKATKVHIHTGQLAGQEGWVSGSALQLLPPE